MGLKFFFDRKKMYIYPWYISDLVATKDIAKITNGLTVKKTFAVFKGDHQDYQKILRLTRAWGWIPVFVNGLKKNFLSDEINQQIKKLAVICQNIEEHYGSPQDIEWALYKNKFYITQSRPITTL